MKLHILESRYWQKVAKRAIDEDLVREIVGSAFESAEKELTGLSDYINITTKPELPHIAGEIGVGGSTYDAELLDITFDSKLPFGKAKFEQYLYQTVFHELCHASRFYNLKVEDSIEEEVIGEGLAVVFERDFGGATCWPKEHDEEFCRKALQQLHSGESQGSVWFFDNAYKLGPWLVDRAVADHGVSVTELVTMPYSKIHSFSE